MSSDSESLPQKHDIIFFDGIIQSQLHRLINLHKELINQSLFSHELNIRSCSNIILIDSMQIYSPVDHSLASAASEYHEQCWPDETFS